jgi:peptidoglycan/LPS O-acetylase OafA/YrhL
MPLRNRGRIPELDGLRGLAILLVLIWHYGPSRRIPEDPLLFYLVKPFIYGWSGVDLFFVLSGFLIGGILLDNRDASNYYRIFYTRRTCRIFPPYYAWLLVFFTLPLLWPAATIAAGWLFQAPLPIVTYASYTQNIAMVGRGGFGPEWLGITWSLAVEEQFYLVLPLLVRRVAPHRLPHTLLLLIGLAPLLRIALQNSAFLTHGGFAGYVLMPCRADALLLGALCAYGCRQERFWEFIRRQHTGLHVALAVAGVSVWWSLRSLGDAIGLSALAIMYCLLLMIVLTVPEGRFARLTRLRWLRWLGGVSYGVYLVHQGVTGLAHGLILGRSPGLRDMADVLVTFLALVITLVVAQLSWTLYERPLVALGHSHTYRPGPASAILAASATPPQAHS